MIRKTNSHLQGYEDHWMSWYKNGDRFSKNDLPSEVGTYYMWEIAQTDMVLMITDHLNHRDNDLPAFLYPFGTVSSYECCKFGKLYKYNGYVNYFIHSLKNKDVEDKFINGICINLLKKEI